MGQKLMAAPVRGKKSDENSQTVEDAILTLLLDNFLHLEKSVRFGM